MIRKAKPEDALHVVPLIYQTISRIGNRLAGTDDDQETVSVLTQFFQQPGNRLSYMNCMVKEVNGKIVGTFVSYHGKEAKQLDQPFIDRIVRLTGDQNYRIETEAQEDEYYLDTVVVKKRERGKGYGMQLVQAFIERAGEQGYDRLGVLVDQDNEPAYQLYCKLGFQIVNSTVISGYLMYRMRKQI